MRGATRMLALGRQVGDVELRSAMQRLLDQEAGDPVPAAVETLLPPSLPSDTRGGAPAAIAATTVSPPGSTAAVASGSTQYGAQPLMGMSGSGAGSSPWRTATDTPTPMAATITTSTAHGNQRIDPTPIGEPNDYGSGHDANRTEHVAPDFQVGAFHVKARLCAAC